MISPACIVRSDDSESWIDSRTWRSEAVEIIRIPVDGIVGLVCTSRSGNLSVTGKPELVEIAVVVHKRVWEASRPEAEEHLGSIQITCEVEGERVLLGWDWPGSLPDVFVGSRPTRSPTRTRRATAGSATRTPSTTAP